MSMCDRCRVSGCLLNYNGKACENARKEICPDVYYTNADHVHTMCDEDHVHTMCDEELVHTMCDEELADFLGEWARKHFAWMSDSYGEVLFWLQEPYDKE